MRKWMLGAVTVMMGAALVTGCGQNNSSNNTAGNTGGDGGTDQIQGSITVLTNRTDLVANGQMQKYAEEFKKLHPKVTSVNFQAIKDYDGTVKVRMNSGSLGDVLLIPNGVPASELPNFFAPLDDLGLTDKVYFSDYETYDGKHYGVASGGDILGLVYNKADFKAAGISGPPKTLDEFYQDCAKLKQKGFIPLAINYKDKWPLQVWDYEAPALSNNPNYLNTLVDTDKPFDPNGPYGHDLGILKTLVTKGYVEPDLMNTDWEQSKREVASGKIAMYLLGQWVIPQLESVGMKSSDIGFAPFPADNSGQLRAALTPDWFYGVAKNSANLATAKAFVKFMVEQSGYANDSGFLPPVKSQQPSLPQLREFMSYKPTLIEVKPASDKFTKIANAAQIDFFGGGYIQQLLKAPDFNQGLQKLNEAWANARSMIQ